MSKYQTISDLAIKNTALFFENRKKAAGYAFEVLEAIEDYLEPPDRNTIAIVHIRQDKSEEVVDKVILLMNKMRTDDPRRYNEFTCGIQFNFNSQNLGTSSSVYLQIIVADKKCKIFGETFDISDKRGIGSSAFVFLKNKYDTNNEKPSIGFVNSTRSDRT